MSKNGSLYQDSPHLDPREVRGHELKRKSEVNFSDTIVTFKPNGNVVTGSESSLNIATANHYGRWQRNDILINSPAST